MTLLTAADLDGAGHQTLTWIARAVVCQHLRLLEFASGGFVAMSQLPGRAPEAGIQGIIHTLVFASASNALASTPVKPSASLLLSLLFG